MKLRDARTRLPVVASLPGPDDRRLGPRRPGELPTPRYAIWEITLACDQKCIHSGSRAGPARVGELDTKTCLDVVAQLRELGVGEVTLVGGEAYLRNDFILVIRAIREAGMRCSITTGGRNLTRARVDAMVEAGISTVSVSIDGLEATHDRLRGVEGGWRQAFAAIDRLRGAGVRTAVNTQINRLSLAELEPLFEHVVRAGAFGWQLQITAPFGNAADHPEILLQPYMMLDVYEVLERIVARASAVGLLLWPANNLGYFGPLEAALRGRQKSGAHYKGCVAGVHQIGLEADGNVKGCPSLGGAENSAGNVKEHRLTELWARAHELAYIRERNESDLWGYCAQCHYADICRGGCTATAEPLLGRPGNNPFCHHRALEMDRMGLRERIEQVARAPGEPFDHGLFRLIREPKEPAQGPVHVEEPRTSRCVHPRGVGEPV